MTFILEMDKISDVRRYQIHITIIMIKHLKTTQEQLDYIKANPAFISGFTSGEGCFTAYLGIDTTLLWGLQPSFEFSITQNTGDLNLLTAFRLYFDSIGNLYDKKDGVSVYMVRNAINIKNIIIPFFLEHPLVGTKSIELEIFMLFMDLVLNKKHLGPSLENRDAFIAMAELTRKLNSKRINPAKLHRTEYIVNWLKSLQGIPSLEQKNTMKENLKTELINLKKTGPTKA